jgi:hypothetical protein
MLRRGVIVLALILILVLGVHPRQPATARLSNAEHDGGAQFEHFNSKDNVATSDAASSAAKV